MKAADYRIPWGRPSEHLLAVKREILEQQKHLQRVHDARSKSTLDLEQPECAHMPHLVTRPKKKKMQEDRQREIAAENHSLMHRLAGIMKEERGGPAQKYAHLSVEYRGSLRRKKLLKLETENRRLARAIKKQRPFYPNRAMEKAEEERQVLLKTMSRTQRRKDRVAIFAQEAAASSPDRLGPGPGHHRRRHRDGDLLSSPGKNGTTGSIGGGGWSQQGLGGPNHLTATSTPYYLSGGGGGGGGFDADATASLVDDGVLFRPGPTAVKLTTAKQMQAEVARRRRGPQEEQEEEQQQQQLDSSLSTVSGGSGGGGGGEGTRHALMVGGRPGRGRGGGGGGGGVLGRGGRVGGQEGSSSSSLSTGSLTVRRKGDSNNNNSNADGERGVVLEVNRTGGGGFRGKGRGGGRCGLTGGRPNMIFTPSLVPLGMESVRACPMSLGGDASRASSARCAGDTGGLGGSSMRERDQRGLETEGGEGEREGEDEAGAVRDARTV